MWEITTEDSSIVTIADVLDVIDYKLFSALLDYLVPQWRVYSIRVYDISPPEICPSGHLLLPEPNKIEKRLTNDTLFALNPKTQILAWSEFVLRPNI